MDVLNSSPPKRRRINRHSEVSHATRNEVLTSQLLVSTRDTLHDRDVRIWADPESAVLDVQLSHPNASHVRRVMYQNTRNGDNWCGLYAINNLLGMESAAQQLSLTQVDQFLNPTDVYSRADRRALLHHIAGTRGNLSIDLVARLLEMVGVHPFFIWNAEHLRLITTSLSANQIGGFFGFIKADGSHYLAYKQHPSMNRLELTYINSIGPPLGNGTYCARCFQVDNPALLLRDWVASLQQSNSNNRVVLLACFSRAMASHLRGLRRVDGDTKAVILGLQALTKDQRVPTAHKSFYHRLKDSTSPQGESILLDRTNFDRALETMVSGFEIHPPHLPRASNTPSAALEQFQTALEQDAATVTTGFSLPRVIQRHRVFYVLRLLGFFFARDHTVVRTITAPHPCRVLLDRIIKVQGGADDLIDGKVIEIFNRERLLLVLLQTGDSLLTPFTDIAQIEEDGTFVTWPNSHTRQLWNLPAIFPKALPDVCHM